jgi:hypothetical protein
MYKKIKGLSREWRNFSKIYRIENKIVIRSAGISAARKKTGKKQPQKAERSRNVIENTSRKNVTFFPFLASPRCL